MASQDSKPFRWHYAEFDDRNFQIRGRTLFFVIVLFSVILLITLLLLYARWICRFRRLNAAAAAAHLPQAPPQQQGLDPATINSFPVVLHPTEAVSGESECCICLGAFQQGDKVKVLPKCHHCYHSDCVDKWLTAQPSCPLCRVSLRSGSPV